MGTAVTWIAAKSDPPVVAPKAPTASRVKFKSGPRQYGTPQLIRIIETGFPYKSFEALVGNMGMEAADLAHALGIPARTLARRKASGRFSPFESERLLRLDKIYAHALALFNGEARSAVEWLGKPKLALGNQTPLYFARTEVGGREVENLIGRIEHGVFD